MNQSLQLESIITCWDAMERGAWHGILSSPVLCLMCLLIVVLAVGIQLFSAPSRTRRQRRRFRRYSR